MVQHGTIHVVAERDAAEGHGAGAALEGPRVGSLGNVGPLVQEREHAFRAREVGLYGRRLPADRFEGIVQLSEVGQHHQQLAEGEDAGVHVAHADEQDGGRPERGRQADQHAEASFDEGHMDARGHAVARAPDEAVGLARLLPERLHHTQRPQRLVDDRERPGLKFLHVPRLLAQAPAVDAGKDEEGRADAQSDEGQRPVEPGCDDDHGRECHRRRDERDHAVNQNVLDRRGVVLDPVERVGGAARIVIEQRQALDLIDDLGAQIQDEPLTDPGAQQRARESLSLTDDGDGEEQADGEEQDGGRRLRHRLRQDGLQERGQGPPAEHRIHHDPERYRVE